MFDRGLQQRSRLGQLLVKKGVITSSQLADALAWQHRRQIRLGTALLELGLVNKQQLQKALRRQVWIRRFAALVALLSTPFTPVMAAGGSGPGPTSSASATISLTVLPKSISTSRGELTFRSKQQASDTSPICVTPAQTRLYRVKAQDLNQKENMPVHQFYLDDSDSKTSYSIPYQVALVHNDRYRPLSDDRYSEIFYARNECDSQSQRLKISLSEKEFSAPMIGRLRLTIAPE